MKSKLIIASALASSLLLSSVAFAQSITSPILTVKVKNNTSSELRIQMDTRDHLDLVSQGSLWEPNGTPLAILPNQTLTVSGSAMFGQFQTPMFLNLSLYTQTTQTNSSEHTGQVHVGVKGSSSNFTVSGKGWSMSGKNGVVCKVTGSSAGSVNGSSVTPATISFDCTD